MQNPKNPLHDAVKEERGSDLQETSNGWAKENSQSRMCAASRAETSKRLGKRPVEPKSNYATQLPENLGTRCRD